MGIWKPSRKVMAGLGERGVRTRATVIRIARAGSTSGHSDSTGRIDDPEATVRARATVRITTPSGETFDVRTRLTFVLAGVPKPGETVPVIYDPADRDVVEVDRMAHRIEALGPQAAPPVNEIHPVDVDRTGGLNFEVGGLGFVGFDPRTARADASRVWDDHLAQMRALHQQGVLSDEQFESIRRQMPGQS